MMYASDFRDVLLYIAQNRRTIYKNSYPYNLGYYDGIYLSFDCWNLGKAIIWTQGAIADNKTVGYSAPLNSSTGLSDWDGLTIMSKSQVFKDFTKIEVGAWLYMDGHMGYYVGDNKVVECTPFWDGGVQISNLDARGGRSKNGINGGQWLEWAKVPWINYNVGNNEKEDTIMPIDDLYLGYKGEIVKNWIILMNAKYEANLPLTDTFTQACVNVCEHFHQWKGTRIGTKKFVLEDWKLLLYYWA